MAWGNEEDLYKIQRRAERAEKRVESLKKELALIHRICLQAILKDNQAIIRILDKTRKYAEEQDKDKEK